MRRNYNGSTEAVTLVATELNRSRRSVQVMAAKLGLTGIARRQWSDEEDDLVEKYYTQPGGIEFLMKELNRSRVAIRIRAGIFGFNYTQQGMKRPPTRTKVKE